VTLANAHLGQTDAVSSTDSMCSESLSEDNVEPDDIRSEVSVNGLPPSTVTSCSNSIDFLCMQKENWVTSVAALHNTDLVVSGKKKKFFQLLLYCTILSNGLPVFAIYLFNTQSSKNK